MTLEEKIGQCLVIGFVGSVATPEILRRIREYDDPACPAKVLVEKPTFGAFTLISNLIAASKNPIEEIHICGFCTEICVMANAVILRAAFPNTPIYIHADACAGVTPESHNAALTVFAAQQMEVVR